MSRCKGTGSCLEQPSENDSERPDHLFLGYGQGLLFDELPGYGRKHIEGSISLEHSYTGADLAHPNTSIYGVVEVHSAYLRELDLHGSYVKGPVRLSDLRAKRIDLSNSDISLSLKGAIEAEVLDLRGANISYCDGLEGLLVGSYIVDDQTKIPHAMKCSLERYEMRRA